jgi:membrane-associated phospholipid phosphatase
VWSGAYWAVGGFAGGRTMTLLSTALEDRVPFLPAATVIYLTVYWFAILPIFVLPDRLSRARVAAAYAATLAPCLLAFAVFPVTLDRPAVDPNDGIFAWALSLVHRADPPHNCLPSSHCAMAMMGGLLLSEVDRRLGALGVLYACIIGVTTVLIKQHYVVDVLAGFAVAATAWWALIRRGTAAAWSRAPSGRAG